ncbi:MAG TPA: FHA domain-containing protein [Polyangiaceae bacterium]
MDPTVVRNLRPLALLEHARATSREDFAREVAMPLLLVRVDDASGELAQSLEVGSSAAGTRLEPGMAFHTATSDRPARPPSIRPPASFGPEQLLVRLIRAPYFAVVLGKRAEAGKAFTERVSVGRARNNDVVLRHESVSKFHAWFARDEGGAYYVADASSHNGTSINAITLPGGEPQRVGSGDVLRFGSVEALFCDAVTLHAALRP